MNKKVVIVLGIIIILGGLYFLIDYKKIANDSTYEVNNYWLCQNGEWQKIGNPKEPQPFEKCPTNFYNDKLKIFDLKANDLISSPLVITGEARGFWFFEASFPIKLLDSNRNEITRAIAQAKSDWMTEDFVPFEAVLNFENPQTSTGFIVFEKDNPSGLIENDDSFELPVRFEASEQTDLMTIKVFFNNSNLDPEFSCFKVFPVNRQIPKTQAVARAAIEELLKGPTTNEKSAGYFTSLPSNVKIQSLSIENGVAKIDFSKELEQGVGGSCRVSAIRAQITETLKQFETVNEVIISIDSQVEDILQP